MLLLAALALNLLQPPDSAANALRADSLTLLADQAERTGDLPAAALYLEERSELAGNADPEAARRLGTVYGWMHEYDLARSWYDAALRADPQNAGAASGLDELAAARNLHLFGTLGGAEVDYAKRGGEAGLFGGITDRIDLIAGASYSDRIFYTRQTYALDAYFHPSYAVTLRLGVREKKYAYPHAAEVRPDDGAYGTVPDLQAEATWLYGAGNEVGAEVEYFRPDLYWNGSLHASNIKVAASLRRRIAGPLRAELIAAVLRDPQSVAFDATGGRAVAIRYGTKGLVGGALGFSDGRWDAEVKFVPDRDLDRSIDGSLFASLERSGSPFTLRYDFLYDRYAPSAALPPSTVHMLTVTPHLPGALEASGGVKVMSRGAVEAMPFVALRYNTGW